MLFNRVGLKLIPETHINGETAGHFPIVFDIRLQTDISEIAISVGLAVLGAGKKAGRCSQERDQTTSDERDDVSVSTGETAPSTLMVCSVCPTDI